MVERQVKIEVSNILRSVCLLKKKKKKSKDGKKKGYKQPNSSEMKEKPSFRAVATR